MSANAPRRAKVYETTPARLLRIIERQASATAPSEAGVADDLADCLEVIHQLANLAGYSKRGRDLVFEIATLAHISGEESVEISYKELAELQNCSTRTVQRQKRDYLREADRPGTVQLIGVEEGDYNPSTKQNETTRYAFSIRNLVTDAVAHARRHPRWRELGRRRQRSELKRAAEELFAEIPDAAPRGRRRKRRRPRLAAAEAETHWKAASTHLRKLLQIATKLPSAERERLFTDPGGVVRAPWLELRAEMDELCGSGSPQPVKSEDLNRGGGQLVRPRADEDLRGPDPSAEDVAVWERLTSRLTAPAVRTVEIDLHGEEPET